MSLLPFLEDAKLNDPLFHFPCSFAHSSSDTLNWSLKLYFSSAKEKEQEKNEFVSHDPHYEILRMPVTIAT